MGDWSTNLPVTPYNPNAGMQSLQGMLGIQAQKLDIQKAQADVQTAQAGAQQAQQKNQELQNLAQFTQKAVNDPAYKMPDGSPNIAKFQNDASAVAPVYGQDAIGKYTENFRSAVGTRRDMQALSNDQNKALSGFFQSVAGKNNPTHDDILNAASQARANNNDPGFNRALDRALMNFDPSLGPQDIQKRAATAANTLGGMTGQAPSTIDTGPAVQTGTTDQYTGAFRPSGAVQKGLAPTEQPAYKSTVTNVPMDAERFSQISNDNQRGQTMVALSKQVSQLADQVRTGKLSGEWADRLAVLNQDSPGITARQMLSKYAAQLKTMAEGGASTDAERGQIEAGMPNPDKMDPAAVKEAAQYVGGMGALRKARNDVASAYVQKNGNTNGVRAVDDQFMQHADPFVYMYRNMPAGQDRQQFLLKKFGDGKQITDKDGLQRFLDQQNIVKHYGG